MREFAQLALIVGAILMAIMLSSGVIRLLGRAASGILAPDAVGAMLAFSALGYLPVVLSLTLFISILLSLSRCYRDSEMVIWFTAGKGLLAWMRPVLMFAIPLALVVAWLTLSLSPWAYRKSAELQTQLDSRDDVSRVTPGIFIESKTADRVFFVEQVSEQTNTVGNVFVQSLKDNRVGLVTAARGYQETRADGERFLVLSKGRHYEGIPGNGDFRTVDFERYTMQIAPRKARLNDAPPKAMALRELLEKPSPANFAELHWRFSMPVSVLLLSLMAIPLSYVNPRAGRSVNLLIAILVFTIYSNLNSVTQAWIAQGKLSPALGLWLVHGIMLAACALMFLHRLGSLSWRRWRARG